MMRLAHRLRNSAGAEIAEAALVMPVVFVFLLGIIWFGRAFNIYSTITQAAQQGAIVAARPVCATCGAPAGSWNGTDFPGDIAVTNAITAVLKASSLDPTLIPSNSNPPNPKFCSFPQLQPPPQAGCSTSTTSNITICREVLLNSTSTSTPSLQTCGTLVAFQYPFSFYLPFTSLNLSQVILNAQAQSRMEN